jgi:hypothetical protein
VIIFLRTVMTVLPIWLLEPLSKFIMMIIFKKIIFKFRLPQI